MNRLALTAATAFLALQLTACGNNNGPAKPTAAATDTPAAQQTQAPAPTQDPAAAAQPQQPGDGQGH